MSQTCFDIAVIGAGMFGSAAAKYLQSDNTLKIALIGPAEPANKNIATSQLVFGAHYDEARITRRLGWDEVWAATDSRSMNRFHAIEKESKIPFFHECGSLVVIANSIANRTESILKKCQIDSIPVERISSSAIEYHWPYLKMPSIIDGVEGLYEDKMAGYLNPRRLVEAQVTIFVNNGGKLIRGTVTNISKDSMSHLWSVSTLCNGVTETIYSKKILLAAGSFVNYNNLLPHNYQLELYTFTEPNLLFEVEFTDLERFQNMPTIITVDPEDNGNNNKSIYLLPPIQYSDGKWYMRIGPGMQPIVKQLDTLEEMRQWYIEQRITSEQREFLLHMYQTLLPNFQPKSILEAACIIEKTPSKYPYLGQINQDQSLYVAVGGNGHGARGSDEIGRLAANMLLGKEWDFPIPQELFKPTLADNNAGIKRLISKPPFGLC